MQGAIKLFMKPTVPVVNIVGIIDSKMTQKVEKSLKRIQLPTAKALAVVISSPGGSPAQSEIIAHKIRGFAKEHHLPLYTFAQDVAASGGYFLLCMGDKVYVDPSSIVGSVGVIAQWMGFKKFLAKHKVETRKFSSNEKLMSHIFSCYDDLEQKNKDQIKKVTDQLHQKFIAHVETYRGKQIKLAAEERKKTIYNGDVFLGQKAVELGLADGVGNYEHVLFNDFPKANLAFVNKKSFFEQVQDSFKIQVKFNISDNLNEINEEALQKQLMVEFLKSQAK